MLIGLADYAALHGKAVKAVQEKAYRGGYRTAVKIGNRWKIDSEEPDKDNRITTGANIGRRKRGNP